ncbi:hypothetical protein [Evansella sp. LMS18]|nr:hypothetical protein [Evansella sp. LMS18]
MNTWKRVIQVLKVATAAFEYLEESDSSLSAGIAPSGFLDS